MQRLKGAEERVKELHTLLLQRTHDLEVREQRVSTESESAERLADSIELCLTVYTNMPHPCHLPPLLAHCLQVAQDVARKLRREYQSTRQDAEGMLQVGVVNDDLSRVSR